MFTALAATSAIVTRETVDCMPVSNFALQVKGNVSVGEKALEVVIAKNK